MNDVDASSGELTLLKAMKNALERAPDRIFLNTLNPDISWSRRQFVAYAGQLAGGLKQLGIMRGQTAGLLMGNRLEYYLADMAVLLLGGVPVSLYPSSSVEQITHIAQDAALSVLFVENDFLPTLFAARSQLDSVQLIVVVDAETLTHETPEDLPLGLKVMTLRQIMEKGQDAVSLDEAAEATQPSDLLTLVYTSGTTGAPKGVQLTHQNMLSAGHSMGKIVGLSEGGRVISWLPHAHVAERSGHYYNAILYGLEVTICPDPNRILEHLRAVKPTWFFAVPRVWEKLKAGIEAELARLPQEEQDRAVAAIDMGIELVRCRQNGKNPATGLAERVAGADALLFAPLREKLGLDKAYALNSGSAPTPLHVLEFFAALGLSIGDIYGSTETCACGTMGTPGDIRLGSAGRPVSGMEVTLAEDDEILLRGAPVMAGYHNQPEATVEALSSDGWYRTGDLGRFDEDGYLWVVDRKKDIIISSGGKNMSPSNIESVMKSSHPLIGQICVIGDARAYNTALIVLDPDYVSVWAAQQNLSYDFSDLATHPEIEAEICKGIELGNERLSRVEQIKRYHILQTTWEPGGDELTPTMKLKRKFVEQKFAADIERLYERK